MPTACPGIIIKEICDGRLDIGKCTEKLDGNVCGKLHNSLLHGTILPYFITAAAKVKENKPDEHASTLMLLQDVLVGEFNARVQWDGGANKILVTHSFAKKAGLREVPAVYWLQDVGEG